MDSTKPIRDEKLCSGKGSALCLVTVEFHYTGGINFCKKAEWESWREILDEEFEIAKGWAKRLDEEREDHLPSILTSLEQSQIHWDAYHTSKCDTVKALYFTGSALGSYTWGCRIQTISDRVVYLKEQNEFWVSR